MVGVGNTCYGPELHEASWVTMSARWPSSARSTTLRQRSDCLPASSAPSDRVMVDNFLNTLAEVAIAAATRKRSEHEK